jgi:hypothetical protein
VRTQRQSQVSQVMEVTNSCSNRIKTSAAVITMSSVLYNVHHGHSLPHQQSCPTIVACAVISSTCAFSCVLLFFPFCANRLELRTALGGLAPSTAPMSDSTMAAAAAAAQAAAAGGPFGSSSSSSSSVLQRSQSAPPQGSVLDDQLYAPGVQKSRVQVRLCVVCWGCSSNICFIRSRGDSKWQVAEALHMSNALCGQAVQVDWMRRWSQGAGLFWEAS